MTVTMAGDSYRNVKYHVSSMENEKPNFIFAFHTFRSEMTSFLGDTKFFARAPSYSAKYQVFRLKVQFLNEVSGIFRMKTLFSVRELFYFAF
jgi:hypothetical protein